MLKYFPHVAFGPCPRCGRRGPSVDGTSADASGTDSVGNGYYLEFFRGKLLCRICIEDIKSDESTEYANDKRERAQAFRARVGFTKS